jgi:hypothetical protein
VLKLPTAADDAGMSENDNYHTRNGLSGSTLANESQERERRERGLFASLLFGGQRASFFFLMVVVKRPSRHVDAQSPPQRTYGFKVSMLGEGG